MRKARLGLLMVLLGTAAAGQAYADTFAVQANNEQSFGMVDLDTGVFTKTETSPVVYSDFGAYGGKLYSGAYLGSGFYSINPANGAGTLINANDGVINGATGSTPSGVFVVDPNRNLST